MALPGFSADLSAYRSANSYSVRGAAVGGSAGVVEPAQSACHRQCFRRICGYWGRKCNLEERRDAMAYCESIC